MYFKILCQKHRKQVKLYKNVIYEKKQSNNKKRRTFLFSIQKDTLLLLLPNFRSGTVLLFTFFGQKLDKKLCFDTYILLI